MRRTLMIGVSTVIFAVGFLSFLCLHGIQERGLLSISLSSKESPKDRDLVGMTIPIDGGSHAKITALSRNPHADGTCNYTIHADLYTKKKQWLSLESWSWPYVYLTSMGRIEAAVTSVAGAGCQLSEGSSDLELLP